MKRRLSAVLLALGLTVSALSTGVYAAETETTAATEQVTEAAQTEAATEKATEAQTEAAVAAAEEELTELRQKHFLRKSSRSSRWRRCWHSLITIRMSSWIRCWRAIMLPQN